MEIIAKEVQDLKACRNHSVEKTVIGVFLAKGKGNRDGGLDTFLQQQQQLLLLLLLLLLALRY